MLRLTMGGPTGIGGTVLEAGYVNAQSLDLDGTGDFVDTNYSNADLQTLQRDDFTVSMWVRAPLNASFCFFGHSDTGNVLAGSFQLNFLYASASVQAVTSAGKSSNSTWGQIFLLNNAKFASGNANNWVHVAYVVKKGVDNSTNGSQELFLDGSSVATSTTKTKEFHEATEVTSGHSGLAFGADLEASSASDHMTGQIDECAVFNVALDANAINEIYNSGVPNDLNVAGTNYTQSMVNALQRYYRFEGSSQSDLATDHSGEGVNATLEGNPTASSETPS
jgi:hypothetical protein